MSKKPRNAFIVLALVAMVSIGLAPLAVSSEDTTKTIKERQEAMESVRDSMMALAAIAKKQQPFDAEVVKQNAANMAKQLKHAEGLFPAGTDKGDAETWAKAEIWSQPDAFAKLMQQTHEAAKEMEKVTDESAFGPALGKIGNGCKNCHDMYRRPKE
jgi:cytochrome c556